MAPETVLEIFQKGKKLREVSVGTDTILLGRDPKCTITLDDQMVSRNHAEIRKVGEAIEVYKKSKFGWMKLNGLEVDQARLSPGDRLEMGSFEIIMQSAKVQTYHETPVAVAQVEVPVSAAAAAMAPTPMQPSLQEPVELQLNDPIAEVQMPEESAQENHAPQEFNMGFADDPSNESSDSSNDSEIPMEESNAVPVSMDMAASSSAEKTNFLSNDEPADGNTRAFQVNQSVLSELIFEPGAANVQHFAIEDNEISIGRSAKCNVVLEDAKSSRKHAIIRRDKLKFTLSDLGSVNGTFVNGNRVDQVELSSGDAIKIGDTEFKFMVRSTDFEMKKNSFLAVEQPSEQSVDEAPQEFQMAQSANSWAPVPPPIDLSPGAGEGLAPPTENAPKNKSFIGNFLQNLRTRPLKVQIMYMAAIGFVFYMLIFEFGEPSAPEPESAVKKVEAKKPVVKTGDDKAKPGLPTFEALSDEQKRYVESQYKISLDYFKNREYEKCLFEVQKIFALVQDYQQAREIETYAREAQRKLAAEEEKRKRMEEEKEKKIKLERLLQDVAGLMNAKKYAAAMEVFPEIEILEPENAQVAQWRDLISTENERVEKAKAEKKAFEDFHSKVRKDIDAVVATRAKDKDYYQAMDDLDEIATRPIQIQSLKDRIKREIKKSEDELAAERDPLLEQANEAEKSGDLAAAFRYFKQSSLVDSESEAAKKGMDRIRGVLNMRAKHLYTEGVFAESFGDYDTAEDKYKEVLKAVPQDDPYFDKATSRLKKLTVLHPLKEEEKE